MQQLLTCVDQKGVEKLPDARFLDWPSSEDKAAIDAGLQALLHLSLKEGAELCNLNGDTGLAQHCLEVADRMVQHAAADAVEAGECAARACGPRRREGSEREGVAKDPLHGMSTFYGYYVLQARALAGDHAGALEVIRNYWGAMLDFGATTFWNISISDLDEGRPAD